MTIDELSLRDIGFQENKFITRANSRIKKIYNAITLNRINEVQHFMSDMLYYNICNIINDNALKKVRVMYTEVNVTSNIKRIEEDAAFYKIIVGVICRYLKYYVDSETMEYISGDRNNRVVVSQDVEFMKKKDSKAFNVFRCFGCGTNFNINESGICPNCGRVYDLDELDYIIKDIEI